MKIFSKILGLLLIGFLVVQQIQISRIRSEILILRENHDYALYRVRRVETRLVETEARQQENRLIASQHLRRDREYLVETYLSNFARNLNNRGQEGWTVVYAHTVFVSDTNDNTGMEVWYMR